MRGVGHQRVAVEVVGEQPLAERDAVLLAHLVEPGRAPDALGRLDDEGRGVVVEAVGMRLEPAPFGFLEREGERVEQLVACRARRSGSRACRCRAGKCPRTSCGSRLFRPSRATIRSASAVARRRVDLASRTRASTPSSSQRACRMFSSRLRPMPQKPWPPERDRAAAEVDLDVVPVVERVEDLRSRWRVGAAQVAERLVGEHDAPAERVVRAGCARPR